LNWSYLGILRVKNIFSCIKIQVQQSNVEGSNLYFLLNFVVLFLLNSLRYIDGGTIVLIVVSTIVHDYRCPGCKNSYKLRRIFELHWRSA
jgi:hypothetical protein